MLEGMMGKNLKSTFIVVLLLLGASCSKDEQVEPVDIMAVTPQLRSIQDQADRMGRDIQDQIQRQMTAAQIQLAREQREVSFDLMKLTDIKDQKKLTLAGKYFALMDFQLFKESENYENTSLALFLSDSKELFPKELKLKSSMRKDKSFNLYAIAIALAAVNPDRTAPANSFLDIIFHGLSSRNNDLINANKDKFLFLLQLRHNALYDLVIQFFDKTPISLTRKFTVTGKGLELETIVKLHQLLLQADETRERLTKQGIKLVEYKKRRKKLTGMKLKIHKSVKANVADALVDIHRHIKENY
jgi:hypothetical protein